MNVIELFAGIGGFRLGLERSGHRVIWSNEWLEKPRRIYKHNFGEYPDGRDIRKIEPGSIPDAEMLCGGFPCATFSIAGKRSGFSTEDTRGTLFFEICRILRAKRTAYVFLENVKGLLNHDNGRTFATILFSLDELGYDVQWELLNSKNFGVPQNRERVFIVGNLRGKPKPKVFPLGEIKGKNVCKEQEERRFGAGIQMQSNNKRWANHPTIDGNYYKGGRTYIEQPEIRQWRRTHFREFKSDGTPTLTANMGTGGHNVPFVTQPTDINGKEIRKLTPLECERLQGLPDNFTQYYDDGSQVPDSERYERCGRTVTINVIEQIGWRFYEFY